MNECNERSKILTCKAQLFLVTGSGLSRGCSLVLLRTAQQLNDCLLLQVSCEGQWCFSFFRCDCRIRRVLKQQFDELSVLGDGIVEWCLAGPILTVRVDALLEH